METKPKRTYTRRVTVPAESYTVTIQLGDKTISFTERSLVKALHDFPRPAKITTKGVLTVQGNGKSFRRLLMPQDMRRILWPVSAVIQAKIIQSAMK